MARSATSAAGVDAPVRGQATARVHGAVTVVNAIPTGLGAAMGIDLWTEARVRLDGAGGGSGGDGGGNDDGGDAGDGGNSGDDGNGGDAGNGLSIDARGPDGPVDDGLVRAVAERVLPAGQAGTIAVESSIPVGCGLKSSSACANAVALALRDAVGRGGDVDRLDAVRTGVEAARAAGVTTTGAFDDACASALGGLCVTDNRRDALLARLDVPDLAVVLRVPEQTKEARSTDPATYAHHRPLFEVAHSFAMEASWAAAFALNATAVHASLDLDAGPILDALSAGAVCAGPTGTGPALAALCPDDRADAVAAAVDGPGVRVLTARTVSEAVA